MKIQDPRRQLAGFQFTLNTIQLRFKDGLTKDLTWSDLGVTGLVSSVQIHRGALELSVAGKTVDFCPDLLRMKCDENYDPTA